MSITDRYLYKMAVWWRVLFPLFLYTLSCISLCCASPASLLKSYSYSLKSTRSTHARVKQLLSRYKEEQLDNKFEDRHLKLESLPSLSTDFQHWLQMKDWERLSAASGDLQTFWAHLDMKRKEMETDERVNGAALAMSNRGESRPSLSKSIHGIQIDLRDLITKVKFQLRSVKRASTIPLFPPLMTPHISHPSSQQASSKSLWISRLEGYIILRDLERYLTKLARDFILLKTRHIAHPGAQHMGR